MIQIKLVGSRRYNYKGEGFESGRVYGVGDAKAEILLRSVDDYGRPYFVRFSDSKKARVVSKRVRAKPEADSVVVEAAPPVAAVVDTGEDEVSNDEVAGVGEDTVILGADADIGGDADIGRAETVEV